MLPILRALILQAAYGAVDLLVVGRFGITSGLSAVSAWYCRKALKIGLPLALQECMTQISFLALCAFVNLLVRM